MRDPYDAVGWFCFDLYRFVSYFCRLLVDFVFYCMLAATLVGVVCVVALVWCVVQPEICEMMEEKVIQS